MAGAPKISATPIAEDLDRLKAIAESEGRLLALDTTVFPPIALLDEPGRLDADGNEYKFFTQRGWYLFFPHEGDHGGATYYFEGGYGGSNPLCVKGKGASWHARNFTLRSDADQGYTTTLGGPIRLGGEGTDAVYVYCRGNVGGPLGNGGFGALGNQWWDGIVFRVGGYFCIRPSDNQTHYLYKLRVIADERIEIRGAFAPAATFVYDGEFDAPAVFFRTRVGRLAGTGL
jgi:hypothetical protein